MKKIGVTLNVEFHVERQQTFDNFDRNWIPFLASIGILPIFIGNDLEYLRALLNQQKMDGFLLTGGNDLFDYGGMAQERDDVETKIIEHALSQGLPVLGVCRGMQMIQHYFGNELERVSGHVAVDHKLNVVLGSRFSNLLNKYKKVKTYHNFGTRKVSGSLRQIAYSDDGVTMAVQHEFEEILGIMWHPERNEIADENDKVLFHDFFGVDK